MSEEIKALVRRQEEELFGRGNLELADEIYAPDYVGHDPSNPEEVRGLQAAKQAAADYRRAFPDLRVTVEDLIAEGDKVAARLRVRGTHLGDLNGIAPTGRRVDFTGIVMSRVEGEDRRRLGQLRRLGHDAAAGGDLLAGDNLLLIHPSAWKGHSANFALTAF